MRPPLLPSARSFFLLFCKHLRFVTVLCLVTFIAHGNAADGDTDITFAAGNFSGSGSDEIRSVVALPNGKILVGGHFTEVNSQATARLIARLGADGTHEAGFNLYDGGATSVTGRVEAVAVQSDGKILIGGSISVGTSEGSRSRLVRLNTDGSIDLAFNSNIGAASSNGGVDAIAVQPDGKILIGGDITQIGATSRNGIARLNATDGSLDAAFDPGTGVDGDVRTIVIQPVVPAQPGDPDFKVLIGGAFTEVNGTTRGRIARLNADGSLDTGFDTEDGADHTVSTIVLQADGKILLGGLFASLQGAGRSFIGRLSADGSLDASFGNVNINDFDGYVRSIAVQPDGKAIIGGDFTEINGTDRVGIARLNADGSLDTSFNPGTGMTSGNGVFNGWVSTLALQADGKVVAGGNFNEVNGQLYDNIVRLQAASSATLPPPPQVVDNSVQKTALSNAVKKLTKKFKKIKKKGQKAKAKKLHAKIKKLKKKLKAL